MYGLASHAAFWFLLLPLLVSVVLAAFLLIRWRSVGGLIIAVLAVIAYAVVTGGHLHSPFGILMFLLSGWVGVMCLGLALFFAARVFNAKSIEGSLLSAQGDRVKVTPSGPPGICPKCKKTIPQDSLECSFCNAVFDDRASWKVEPL